MDKDKSLKLTKSESKSTESSANKEKKKLKKKRAIEIDIPSNSVENEVCKTKQDQNSSKSMKKSKKNDEDVNTKDIRDKDLDAKQDIEHTEIKSANSWEEVDLGSKDRNMKFLKLMGAAKTKQQGIFHIGQSNAEKHTKAGDNLSQLDESMKKQFAYGMDQRNLRGHQGIGSKTESITSEPSESDSTNKYKMNFVKSTDS